jgi:uncharacterized repeat protein (TIGR03803 family)
MNSNEKWRFVVTLLASITITLAVRADAQTETILHNFSGAGGEYPSGGLLLDSAGNLYGSTFEGGNLTDCQSRGCGVVFRLSDAEGSWQEAVIRDLPSNADGGTGLISDASGNLYGITLSGGGSTACTLNNNVGCGTVFELSPTATGQWTRTLLHAFTGGSDGGQPLTGLVFDAAGNLYGTTSLGGAYNYGGIYRLARHFNSWTETVVHDFTCHADGCDAESSLIIDSAGNLYGTASYSSPGDGVAFEISPGAGGRWKYVVLHQFLGGADGNRPSGSLTLDAEGNLYGTTTRGGSTNTCFDAGCGTVFELSPSSSGSWTETILHSFVGGDDGDAPDSGVNLDAAGNLYGVTLQGGGALNFGSVFKLSSGSDGTWTETLLHSFSGATSDGEYPSSPLSIDGDGNLYGTTSNGGVYETGVAYEITP